ncbi:MAG: hypothetical protein ACREBG_14900 [Pyrinomonadaceae bacterium]
MPRLFHSVAVQEKAVAADGIEVFDLAVNPLSAVLLNIRPLNDTGTLANFKNGLDLAAAFNRISILHKGAAVFSMKGEDACALNYYRHGMTPYEANGDDVDNERRCMTLPILLGKFAYDQNSCFPASKRGELTMELDIDVADTGYDGFRYSVETIELIDAKPKEYERKTSISKTFAATGFQDFDLPNGNVVRGLQLFGTTAFDGASPVPTWGRIELVLDNQQLGYASSDFEVLHQLSQLMGRQSPVALSHLHEFEPVAGVRTLGVPRMVGKNGWDNYAYMDLDPTRDDTYAVNTAGSSSFLLRANVETADAARVVMIERIPV